jgi:hypothetical protein
MNPPPGRFQVSWNPRARQQVNALALRAAASRFSTSFAEELARVVELLETRPREWGDPLYSLQAARLSVYRGLHAQIWVRFGVHEVQSLVFVQAVGLLPRHPLSQGG